MRFISQGQLFLRYLHSFDVESQQVIELPTQADLDPKYMDSYQQSANGYQFQKQFPTDNPSKSNVINFNFLPTIILPIDKYLKEKPKNQEHSPMMRTDMEMKMEPAANNSSARAENAPINIKNLGK